jgi:hypothetical protein
MKISKKAFLGIVLIGLSFNILAQVGIGTSNPHVSAALEIQSTSKGFLFPRMTEVARDAISNIATGLTIYCTDCGTSGEGVLQVYNASNWEDLNDFVSASTGGMFTEKVGIGTIGTTPIYALDVDANNKGSSTYSARFTNSATDDNIYNIVLFTQGESDTAIGYLGTGGSGVLNAAFKKSFVVGTKNNSPLVLNTNDTEQMRIDALGNVGIDTPNPKSKLHISGGSADWNETIQGLSIGSIHLDPGNWTNNFGNAITFGASDYSSGENAQAGIYVRSDSSYGTKMYFSTSNSYTEGSKTAMSIDHNGKVGIGTTNPNHKLEVIGTIKANILKSNAYTWSDFVFESEYKLPTLRDVENHIKEKGHLKDIPSASEVQKNGINLGEMDAKLLQKIEELTLYTIDQQKEIEELKKQNSKIDKLQNEIDELKALVQKLLKDKN